ncbi:MAG: hypothetical protein LBN11_07475 [Tannerella sp.]|jgi:hypothetical protein|nr:hypothetical protein [Tannerella sp.]
MATENRPKQVGRKPKNDPCSHHYSFKMNDTENARFLALFDESGLKNKSQYITSCIFDKQLKVVKIDKAAMDYYMRLTTFHSQFRAIGVNYNQITKALKSTFTEKKALAFLYKLEQETKKLVDLQHEIIALTEEFKAKYF